MGTKTFFLVIGLVFALIAFLHLLRLWYGWRAEIGGWEIPMWLSGVAAIISVYLASQALRLRRL